ncbi:putative phosphoinositide phosphatase [Tieghemostelium lacteum]|uniref:Putative phosphoinositide phosphatase n=1 Tax=Tieghemostelium lacteum TaxID=361077 RepID=A0A151Z584_TIELA|nr:putative phosphoinositide phosphatase [Tieghemostelium lacteum]|eukprot:KYQ89139.1 putative phosphoinositide phosphatase [Tieghemostelium lacteum]
MELINTNEKFILTNRKKNVLVIEKQNNEIYVGAEFNKINEGERVSNQTSIAGFIGIANLLSGNYLIVFRDSKRVGDVLGNEIYQIKAVELIPYHPNQQSLVSIPEQHSEEQHLEMIRWLLNSKDFYYCPNSVEFDVTQTLQRWNTIKDQKKPIWETADPRFFWNSDYLERVIKLAKSTNNNEVCQWIVPIFMGFVETGTLNGKVEFTLISRRNLNRAGTRYYVRGIDKEGNVANNVETEQIIQISKDTYSSFVQVRGSIPLFWSQFPDLKYKPKVQFYGTQQENDRPLSIHFNQLNQIYGNVTAVNLIDRKGSELALGNAFEKGVKDLKSEKTRFVWFDFHKECAKMRYDKIQILIDLIKPDIDKNSYFYVRHGQVVSRQTGIIRTNCIDNLDRTNVVQSIITRNSLTNQLDQLKLESSVFSDNHFNGIFKNIWANHGDTISLQYSGTGALKNDFTRTGKRSLRGVIRDGENSLARYYLNNFRDGVRQDSFYLFTHHNDIDLANHVERGSVGPSPIFYFLVILLLAFVFWWSYPIHPIASVIFWVGLLFILKKIAFKYNREIVDKPRLFPLESSYPLKRNL